MNKLLLMSLIGCPSDGVSIHYLVGFVEEVFGASCDARYKAKWISKHVQAKHEHIELFDGLQVNKIFVEHYLKSSICIKGKMCQIQDVIIEPRFCKIIF